jgi:hypothetical protein
MNYGCDKREGNVFVVHEEDFSLEPINGIIEWKRKEEN